MPPAMNYVLAGLDGNNADITGSIRERMLGEIVIELPPARYPSVDRSNKAERLVPRAEPPLEPSASAEAASPHRICQLTSVLPTSCTRGAPGWETLSMIVTLASAWTWLLKRSTESQSAAIATQAA